ncbi:MAG: Crp/Fnr family transcriptional regulator [Heteroscytonema crispum UTEX LB 1556]
MKNNSLMPIENRLLAALPTSDYERLIPHLKLVSLSLKQVIYEPNEPITHVYFPHKAVVSLLAIMKDGSTVEIGLVSNEGMVGIPVILGGNTTPLEAVVQVANSAMRMNADVLKAEFDRGGALQSLLLRYIQALNTH